MSQNCFWFAPPPRRKNSARRRRRRSKFLWKNGGKSVGGALRRPQFGLWKTVKFCIGASILPSSHLFSKSLNEWISPTTPPPPPPPPPTKIPFGTLYYHYIKFGVSKSMCCVSSFACVVLIYPHQFVCQKPENQILESLLYQARTYFQNK